MKERNEDQDEHGSGSQSLRKKLRDLKAPKESETDHTNVFALSAIKAMWQRAMIACSC